LAIARQAGQAFLEQQAPNAEDLAAHCPIKFVRSSLTRYTAFGTIRCHGGPWVKPASFLFTALPGKEYVEVHHDYYAPPKAP
jgi:hypothetical protein